jgi:hypothetical protein
MSVSAYVSVAIIFSTVSCTRRLPSTGRSGSSNVCPEGGLVLLLVLERVPAGPLVAGTALAGCPVVGSAFTPPPLVWPTPAASPLVVSAPAAPSIWPVPASLPLMYLCRVQARGGNHVAPLPCRNRARVVRMCSTAYTPMYRRALDDVSDHSCNDVSQRFSHTVCGDSGSEMYQQWRGE